jgi:hypothetical protein
LWFGDHTSRGYAVTHDAALAMNKPFMIVFGRLTKPSEAADWIRSGGFRILNVAGHRESVSPGFGERVEAFMLAVFRRLR